jgi:hypothetical protein
LSVFLKAFFHWAAVKSVQRWCVNPFLGLRVPNVMLNGPISQPWLASILTKLSTGFFMVMKNRSRSLRRRVGEALNLGVNGGIHESLGKEKRFGLSLLAGADTLGGPLVLDGVWCAAKPHVNSAGHKRDRNDNDPQPSPEPWCAEQRLFHDEPFVSAAATSAGVP